MSFSQLFRAWAAIAVAMIANGILRETVIRPAVGSRAAEVISVLLGIAIITIMTRWLLRPLAGAALHVLVRAAADLVLLTVAFEFLFGRYVDGKSWQQLVDNYAIWRGKLWPIALTCVALMPFVWGRWFPPPRRLDPFI